jgi:N-acetylglucosaminyldiphosphoundecaprenol N-acetyl-beta-D-mannosaminyltransferase
MTDTQSIPGNDLGILSIRIHNITMNEAIDRIIVWLNQDVHKQVAFVNADCANISQNNEEYLRVLNNADLCLGDGIGIRIAAKINGTDIVQNVNGTDMFPLLCKALSGTRKRLYYLGARPDVISGLVDWTTQNYPDLIIAGEHHGYFKDSELEDITTQIRQTYPDLLLVAFGAPKQDLWISEFLSETGAKVGIGVGGLFDFYSGRIPRAPIWMRRCGLEWLYRLIQEPGRLWRRYLIGNFVFLYRVVKSRIRK